MATRCKFVCSFKREYESGVDISLYPVYSGSEENKQFFSATPAGKLDLNIVNKEAAKTFETGKEYYIDIFAAD